MRREIAKLDGFLERHMQAFRLEPVTKMRGDAVSFAKQLLSE
jgi:hypothetical protein